MANHYEVPNWAGKPPVGLHLDVLKGDQLIQKLMIDEKKSFLFGRNSQINDFCVDHASCSRVHAALVWHKHLNIAFLVDLGSTHGSFIRTLRLEPYKPTQLSIDSSFHFGASTRNYIIRKRPIIDEIENILEETKGRFLDLPESDTEVDNLTQFNTAHNRRISMVGISDGTEKKNTNKKRKRNYVSFNEDEEIINPEDLDPRVGKFRNLVQSTIVLAASKRAKVAESIGIQNNFKIPRSRHNYQVSPPELCNDFSPKLQYHTNLGNVNIHLGMVLPNSAPDVDIRQTFLHSTPFAQQQVQESISMEPRKKKYVKEAWPGKKQIHTLLI